MARLFTMTNNKNKNYNNTTITHLIITAWFQTLQIVSQAAGREAKSCPNRSVLEAAQNDILMGIE